MSTVETIRVGDEPLVKVTILEDGEAVDVSGVNTRQIKLQKPDGTTLTKTASNATDGTDGVIQYQSEEGDFDTAGRWKYAGRVVDSAGRPYESAHQQLIVARVL